MVISFGLFCILLYHFLAHTFSNETAEQGNKSKGQKPEQGEKPMDSP